MSLTRTLERLKNPVYERQCAWCGTLYEAASFRYLWCSKICRQKGYRSRLAMAGNYDARRGKPIRANDEYAQRSRSIRDAAAALDSYWVKHGFVLDALSQREDTADVLAVYWESVAS